MARDMCKDVIGCYPYGELGQGDYSKYNITSLSTAAICAAYVIKALDNVNYDPNSGRPFTICDYGAADGLTSLNVMTKIIEHVRMKYGKDVAINIIYEDRPTNDFSSLFRVLSGELDGPFPNYQTIHQNVFVFASGKDFFHQCSHNDSIHFAYSSAAMHYLSKRPCQLQDAIHVSGSRDPQEKALFAGQAAKDWCTILLHRAKEIVPGGQMLLCMPVIHFQDFGGNLCDIHANFFNDLAQTWREMIQDGRISQEEFAEMTFSTYYQSVDEYAAPFRDHTSAVYRAGLRLVALETKITPCPVQTEWLKQENKGSASCRQEFAQKAVAQIRVWSNWLFLKALNKERPFEEKAMIVEDYWKRFGNLTASNLDKRSFDNPCAYIWIQKIRNI